MNKKFLLLCLIWFKTAQTELYKAVCTLPVANLFHPALHEKYPKASEEQIEELYEYFPIATVNNKDCLRIHQLLFHEVVSVIQEWNNEVCVKINNVFYHNSLLAGKQDTFWTLKKYITPLEFIPDQELIPKPLDYNNPASFEPAEKTIFTLVEPFFDTKTNTTYSVRTRFTLLEIGTKKVTVACYEPEINQIEPLVIPKEYGVINKLTDNNTKISSMVNLLMSWAQKEHPFPSARGGCSAKERTSGKKYQVSQLELPDGQTIQTYERHECTAPFAGFDAIGAIMSACQIFHIPFCAKNTKTVGRYLPFLNPDFEELEVGDIILSKGYAGIIADLEKNLIIEARGYTYHDGTLRMVPLAKSFKGIRTTTELFNSFKDKKLLTLIDNLQNGMVTFPFVIVKTKALFEQSVWNFPHNFLF
jgi:hypothetical protein